MLNVGCYGAWHRKSVRGSILAFAEWSIFTIVANASRRKRRLAPHIFPQKDLHLGAGPLTSRATMLW